MAILKRGTRDTEMQCLWFQPFHHAVDGITPLRALEAG